MSDKENHNNTTETGNVEKSVITSGEGNISVNVNVHNEQPSERDKPSEIINKNFNPTITVIFVCIAIFLAAAYFWNKSDKPPKFVIANPILRSDAVLIIKAGNEAANRKELLTVEFDGFAFAEKGIPVENQANNKRQCWHFSPIDQIDKKFQPEKLKDGEHQIRAGFSDGDLVDVQKIAFFSKPPVTAIQITDANGAPNAKEIKVKAASELQIPENKLTVEMVFFHEGEEQTLSLPVTQVRDPKTGILCYEFQTRIQGFKEFSDNDPRRAEPFFGLKITDQAGNSYYQEQSYDQYMAKGTNRFGVNDLAGITVEKVPDAVSKQFTHLVRLTPQPPRWVDRLSDGVPPIKLEKVEVRTDNSRYLEWKSRVKEVKGLTLVFRDEKPIGVSTTNSYIDTEKLDKDSADYRVEQEGKDGTRYLSNKETITIMPYKINPPILNLPSVVTSNEDTPIYLTPSQAYLQMKDGSQYLKINVSGIPQGVVLSAGSKNSDGTWTLTQDQMPNLTLITPNNMSGKFTLTFDAIATQISTGEAAHNIKTVSIEVIPIPDEPVWNISNAFMIVEKGQPIYLNIDPPHLTDTDGSEYLSSITISGVPQWLRLSAGQQTGTDTDGNAIWTISPNMLAGLKLIPNQNTGGYFLLNLSVASVERENGSKAFTSGHIDIRVR